ncbi:MAG: amidase family protein [Planctomycetaceae bacterium]
MGQNVQREALKLSGEQSVQSLNGETLGPLAGIPIGIKDIIDIAGSATGCGFTPFVHTDHPQVATSTAPIVQKLLDAGAVVVGKTVTTQFASFDPPETRNPWNLQRTPGGSSSGSAAAVASGTAWRHSVHKQVAPSSDLPLIVELPVLNRADTLPMEGIYPLSKRLDHVGFLYFTQLPMADCSGTSVEIIHLQKRLPDLNCVSATCRISMNRLQQECNPRWTNWNRS